MAVNFAPAPAINPAMLAQLLKQQPAGISSDQELALQKLMLEPYLKDIADTGPLQHPMQAVARAVNGGIAGYRFNKLLQAQRESDKALGDILGNLPGLGGPQQPVTPMPSNPMGALPGLGNVGSEGAIASGGDSSLGSSAPPLGAIAKALGGLGGDKPLPMGQPPMPDMGQAPVTPSQLPLPQPRPQTSLPAGVMSDVAMANQPAELSGGNPAQGIDRSRIATELQNNPALVKQYADMVNGEVSYRDPKQALIQAETAADRALTRNIPLAQALLAVNDPAARQGNKNIGYYASDTYSRPANAQQFAQFQNDILPKVLGGSEEGFNTLGFRPTGNASGQFAVNRSGRGIYDKFAWPSGQPGRGEMFATEGGDTARMAKNLKSNFPAELLSPKTDAMNNSFAPVQVASSDGAVGIPPAQQSPAVGAFTPGALPNVQTAAVRPTGPLLPQGRPQAPMQPQPQFAQTQQRAPAKQSVNIPPDEAAQIRAMVQNPRARAYGMKLYERHLKSPEYAPLGDNALYDKHTGAVMSVDVNKKTNDIRNYDAYSAQEQAAGRKPMSLLDFELAMKRAGATAITNDMRGENAFSQAAGKHQAERFNDLAQDGYSVRQSMSDINTLRELGSALNTGKIAEFKKAVGPYAEALGVKVDGLPEAQAFDAIVSRVAPTLRVKGSGAQSDFELRGFLKSLPSLGNTPEGNEIISKTLDGLYNNKITAAKIGADALTGKISRDDAEEKLRNLPDPMAEWRRSHAKSNTNTIGNQSPSRDQIEQELRRRGVLR